MAKKNHYTYLIFNELTSEYYIGVRSCDCSPEDDPYMGSPSDKELRKSMRTDPVWSKFIIETYADRRSAVADETDLIRGHLNNGKCRNNSAGGTNWMEFSADAKYRMGASTRGKQQPPEIVADRVMKLRGKKRSSTQRVTMSEAAKRRGPPSLDTRKRMSESQKGRTHSLETRAKMSKPRTPEQRERYRQAALARHAAATPEQRIALAAKGWETRNKGRFS